MKEKDLHDLDEQIDEFAAMSKSLVRTFFRGFAILESALVHIAENEGDSTECGMDTIWQHVTDYPLRQNS